MIQSATELIELYAGDSDLGATLIRAWGPLADSSLPGTRSLGNQQSIPTWSARPRVHPDPRDPHSCAERIFPRGLLELDTTGPKGRSRLAQKPHAFGSMRPAEGMQL
jgi:hypothetical protein